MAEPQKTRADRGGTAEKKPGSGIGSEEMNNDGSMPLTDHLREMRNRIVICLAVFVIGMVVCLSLASKIVTILTDMGARYNYQFVYIAPQELLMSYFTIAFAGGIVIAVPVIAYHAYAFCSPGLTKSERMYFGLAMIFGAICFCVGVAFAYFITVPFMLGFLISFTKDVNVRDSISIGEYLNFLVTVFLIFGTVFEMPVISVILTRMGIIRAEWLAKARKVMIVVIFFLAAVITPPDVVSQVMVALPMLALYEIAILLSRIFRRK